MVYVLLEQKPLINLAYVQERAITCPPTLHSSSSVEQPPCHLILVLSPGPARPSSTPSPIPPRIRAADPVSFTPDGRRQPTQAPALLCQGTVGSGWHLAHPYHADNWRLNAFPMFKVLEGAGMEERAAGHGGSSAELAQICSLPANPPPAPCLRCCLLIFFREVFW